MPGAGARFPHHENMTAEPTERPDFAAIYDRFFARVYNYVRYRVAGPQAADDITSRVFEKALGGFESFDPKRAPLEAWLFAIARNAVSDHFRSRKLRGWLPLDLFSDRPDPAPGSEELLAADEARRGVLEALQELDEREREIIALKFGAEMTNRAIAAQSGLGESNVAVILHRAVKKLSDRLEGKS